MPTCPRCKHCFKTLPEEEQDHNCPKCGWGPEECEEVMDKCFNCGKQIPEKEAQEMERAGVEPFCSLYCSNAYSGVPMPWEGVNWPLPCDVKKKGGGSDG